MADDHDFETRFGELHDQIYAVQLLLLSHVAACDLLDDAPTQGTLEIAKSQIDSLKVSRARVALRLQLLCDEVEKVAEGDRPRT